MLDVLLATEKFIQILDSRRLPGQPREDQIGLANILEDLTYDYELINDTLFSEIDAEGATNIGGGMRVGLSILGDARANTSHFIVLLTDGWPNHYDFPYSSPTSFGISCGSNDPCQQTLEYIDEQIAAAQAQNVTIFTIGLGEDLNTLTFDASSAYGPGTENYSGMDLLRRISNSTGGQAYHAPTSEELEQIFEWIANAIFVRLTL